MTAWDGIAESWIVAQTFRERVVVTDLFDMKIQDIFDAGFSTYLTDSGLV